jgi:dipeptidyl aminopeptidase/acylaminoacyl peptidase
VVRRANPITYIAGDEPPFLILHGLRDSAIPVHQSELLFEALAAAGDEATLVLIDNLGHAFLSRSDLDDTDKHSAQIRTTANVSNAHISEFAIFETIESFFARHLGRVT